MTDRSIQTVTRGESQYPARMRELSNMPETLYYIGELPDPETPSVAIVGARLCSHYGRSTAYEFGRVLGENGVQVISGLAAGIDGSSQEGALDGGGRSYAVLGCGVDICYPRAHTTLYNRLREQGGLLSEQLPGTPPVGWNFPARNRIISALADIVLVVEARAQSGSLITVDFALSQGRTVYAVPGRVGDALSDGCNYLIAQGAGIAYGPEAILQELKLMQDTVSFFESRRRRMKLRYAAEQKVRRDSSLSEEGRLLYGLLSWEGLQSPDSLALRAGLPVGRVRAALMELTAEELAEEVGRDGFRKRRLLIK